MGSEMCIRDSYCASHTVEHCALSGGGRLHLGKLFGYFRCRYNCDLLIDIEAENSLIGAVFFILSKVLVSFCIEYAVLDVSLPCVC